MSTPDRVIWDTNIAVVLRDGLQIWQKLNATAFLASGIADADSTHTIHQRALRRAVVTAIYPEAVFATNNDDANRATIADVPTDRLALAGVTVRGDKRQVDKVTKSVVIHP